MARLIEQHPEVAACVQLVHDGRAVDELTSGSAVLVDAACPVCGTLRERVRVADLVRRPRCRACSPRSTRRPDAPTGVAPMTLRQWVLTRMADAGSERPGPCPRCDRDGGRDAGLVIVGTQGAHRDALLDRPGCAHRPQRAWGMHLLAELVDRAAAELPAGSSRIVAWSCRLCAYRWQDSIRHRTTDGRSCPRCTVVAQHRTLAVRHRRELPQILERELVGLVVDADGAPVTEQGADGDDDAVRETAPGQLKPDDPRVARWRCSCCETTWDQPVADRYDLATGRAGRDELPGCPLAEWTARTRRTDPRLAIDGPHGQGNPHMGPVTRRVPLLRERAYGDDVRTPRHARDAVAALAAQLADAALSRQKNSATTHPRARVASSATAVTRAAQPQPVLAPDGRPLHESWAVELRAMTAVDAAAARRTHA